MAKKKFPYLAYTEEEVIEMENGYFNIIMGGDFISQDSFYLFTKKEALKVHGNTIKKLMDIVRSGNEKDREHALELIGSLTIRPMRLH